MIDWLSSKVAALVFAATVFVVVLGIGASVNNLATLDTGHREAYSLARTIESTCASPFNAQTIFQLSSPKRVETLAARSSTVFVGSVGKAVHCRLQNSSFTSQRITIRKTNGVITLTG